MKLIFAVSDVSLTMGLTSCYKTEGFLHLYVVKALNKILKTTESICIKITLVDRTYHGDCYRLVRLELFTISPLKFIQKAELTLLVATWLYVATDQCTILAQPIT